MLASPAAMQWVALAVTVGAETGGMILWSRLTGRKLAPAAFAVLLVNLVTHPIFWRLQDNFGPGGLAALYAAEGVVVLVEAAAYRTLLSVGYDRALLLSFLLNLLSYTAGILIW